MIALTREHVPAGCYHVGVVWSTADSVVVVIGTAVLLWFLFVPRVRHRRRGVTRNAVIAARADQQNVWMLAGDLRGLYGDCHQVTDLNTVGDEEERRVYGWPDFLMSSPAAAAPKPRVNGPGLGRRNDAPIGNRESQKLADRLNKAVEVVGEAYPADSRICVECPHLWCREVNPPVIRVTESGVRGTRTYECARCRYRQAVAYDLNQLEAAMSIPPAIIGTREGGKSGTTSVE